MRGISAIKRTLRGEVRTSTAALEAVRRMNSALLRRRERAQLEQLNRQPARLLREFARMSHAELLAHFRERESPKFFPGFVDVTNTARLQREIFPEETQRLLVQAATIAKDHSWSLLGFGAKCFGPDEINWNRDPLSGYEWPLDYHADINLFRRDGSDARVLWELNRLSHLITLGRAYTLTQNEALATEFLRQVRSWRAQNPVGRGANWACAMEVALRAMNLLAAFSLFMPSAQIDEDALAELLMIFDQHGAHIRRNLEYSHIATSNHYMCDVAGLLWLGMMLPELQDTAEWREFGLRELLNEVEKQILPDGADSESSTGYHRLKLELLLYSFVLCRENGIEIEQKYWQKLRGMADYTRAYLRPDGWAPLIGDSDSGQFLPIVKRAGDEHGYVIAIADAAFGTHASGMQTGTQASSALHARGMPTEEVLWILGEHGGRNFETSTAPFSQQSQAFSDAGIYFLRYDDLYLLFNASACGLNGRGSHGHNDALSIEVSACGTSFILDPGSYVYTADLHERHLFRSTAYHSTVQIDSVEQNTTDEQTPFVIGDEAHPRVVEWETTADFDYVVAEHDGYRRLNRALTHRRSVRFDKTNRFWMVEDEFTGAGPHQLATRFHLNSGLATRVYNDAAILTRDVNSGAGLIIHSLDLRQPPDFAEQFTSRVYGEKCPSIAATWEIAAVVPHKLRWLLLPIRPQEDERERLETITGFLK
jgi:heparinase II/III-like protein